MEKVIGPTISGFAYNSNNSRLEATVTDNLSGVKDVLFTQKETIDETDWSTASQYYEKDSSSDKYYSKNIDINSDVWYCYAKDVSNTLTETNKVIPTISTLQDLIIPKLTFTDYKPNWGTYMDDLSYHYIDYRESKCNCLAHSEFIKRLHSECNFIPVSVQWAAISTITHLDSSDYSAPSNCAGYYIVFFSDGRRSERSRLMDCTSTLERSCYISFNISGEKITKSFVFASHSH